MRLAAVLLLFASAALAQDRDAPAILADHALALGDAAAVKSLKSQGSVNFQGRTFPSCETLIALGKGSYKSMFVKASLPPQTEWFSSEGAFVASEGHVWRMRPGQESGRALYYVLQALADPFPLLPYARNAAAARHLKVGATSDRKYEALRGPVDEFGVYPVYFVSTTTRQLESIRFHIAADKQIAAVFFLGHRRVGDVMLPHQITAHFGMIVEDAERKRFGRREFTRTEVIEGWVVNPPVPDTALVPPPPGGSTARGFERVRVRTGMDPHECAVGDVDGDGRTDVAVACWNGVSIHYGGAFDKPAMVAVGRGQHRGLAIDDLDGDGRPEIVTSSNVGPAERYYIVSIDAQRNPTIIEIYGAPLQLHALKMKDLDYDGLPDFVATGFGSKKLHIDFNNGAMGPRLTGVAWPLETRTNRDRRGLGVAVGHLDADNLYDIAVCDGKRIIVFQGGINLSFQPKVEIKAGPRPVDVVFADLNGDGRGDLVVANAHPAQDLRGDIAVLLNTGTHLKQHHVIEAGQRTPALAAGRFDADAHVDIAVASFLTGQVVLLHGDGTGKLGRREVLASGRGTHRLAVADIDRDGRDDICAVNRLDDSLSLFLNRREFEGVRRKGPARARVARKLEGIDFTLKGLSAEYRFVAEYRLPVSIRDPSGLAFLGGTRAYTQLVLVSDKTNALFRATLDRSRKRLLVGPPIPLRGGPKMRLDLEGLAFDHRSGNLFLGCEADSHVLRVSLFGHVFGRASTTVKSTGNDGLEALALRRKKDGTPLLYAFRERIGKTMAPPSVHVLGLEESPFALPLRQELKLPVAVMDQTGATISDDKLLVVSRLARALIEVPFDGDGFAKTFKLASYRQLTDVDLGLVDPRMPIFGLVEAVTVDEGGDLYLLVDNNGQEIGLKGLNRGREGRLLWFRRTTLPRTRMPSQRVVVQHLHIPCAGAKDNPDVDLTREEAAKRAQECLERVRAGDTFERLVDRYHYAKSRYPEVLTVVMPPLRPQRGELTRKSLPTALGELAFALEVGEAGVCEFHATDAPFGYHVLKRVR